MSRTRKAGFIICFLIGSQLVRFCLENMFLYEATSEDTIKPGKAERVLPAASEYTQGSRYGIHYFYKSEGFGNENWNPYDVTLVLHGSVDRLHRLIEITRVWRGPISMSVFAPAQDASFLDDAIDGLRLCWTSIRKTTSFHIVYPTTAKGNTSNIGSFVYLSCKDIIRRLRRKVKTDAAEKSIPYPHNVMRNVAHKGVITSHVLHIDADLKPTGHLRDRLLEFLKLRTQTNNQYQARQKDLYILPVFEVRHEAGPIRNKTDLFSAFEKRQARPYMQELCPQCHKATNHELWFRSSSSTNITALHTSYTVRNIREWEPYFVSVRKRPHLDERITSYGHDRLVHMCELQANGFKFHVLSDEFLLHHGYRNKATMSQNERSRKEQRTNFYSKFIKVLGKYNYVGSKYSKCYH
ncbi:beta-1,4-glucuronyltransferase 1-like isoform X1 [Clavelina lepadiformis]|uniref:beta-1,4-glucuronyltransferase 1-like isoform X1 n=1 Tax=Clavelina lepadiformis TaxID=159417 RepID=UPI0040418282